ncbi:MAG: Tex family protein [Candidatus Roizmanbacteria bacterium]
MNINHVSNISQKLNISNRQVESVLQLLQEGSTVPFIARYRKEMTGSLDEVVITSIRDNSIKMIELDKRKEAVLKSIQEQGKLTPELEKKVQEAQSMTVLEDIYLPYKQKRRTKAIVAKEKGLEPLAQLIYKQEGIQPQTEAEKYINKEKGITTVDEALQGARDIIAEWINEDIKTRSTLRTLFLEEAIITSKQKIIRKDKVEEINKYKDYFEWSENLKNIPSHRLLAILRGQREGFLIVKVAPSETDAIKKIEIIHIKNNSQSARQVRIALLDSYERLLQPSLESEVLTLAKEKADTVAIKVFTDNVRELLLSPPLGEKAILAIDPGFRTGCKVVALDRYGSLLEYVQIFPMEEAVKAMSQIKELIKKYKIEAIAIGNGTASRETETFIRQIGLPSTIVIIMVNESGASIYSASDVAREEFPDKDITVRGAVSIGRRLMDPLAELVKLDPKSIGVGQYQHDVDQSKLQDSLDDAVMSVVNSVGVDLNTASKQILTYVSGLGPQIASNIIKYRNEHGPFKSRAELKKVEKMGAKKFEQSAGFLRIQNAKNILDSSAVHPERYTLVEKMAKDLGISIELLIKNEELRKKIRLENYVNEEVGLPTLRDIVSELEKPGRDPRKKFEAFQFAKDICTVDDLKIGMKLDGIVTNVTAFGAFVDIGVHQDGLVHISQLADSFIKDPNLFVKVQQQVKVKVVSIDAKLKRISLSMKGL